MISPIEFAFEKGIINEETKELGKVKLRECYEEIIKLIEDYMDMPEERMKLIALWIIGTYFHDSFNTYPFLYINAMRGSGKTRLLKIISHLSKGGMGRVQTGITESTLFRMTKGNTLVLDELESIGSKEKGMLREYMNASYKKGGSVPRNKKIRINGQDEWIIEHFQPYKPIAMANIWGMDEVLEDRCISLILEKSTNPAKTKKQEDFENNDKIDKIKRILVQCRVVNVVSVVKRDYIRTWNKYINDKYNNYISTLTTHTTQTTQNNTNNIILDELFNKIDVLNFDGRNLELYFPLFILAEFLGRDVLEEILEISKEIVKFKKEDEFTESRDVLLYEFIAQQESNLNYQPMKELTQRFKIFVGEDNWVNEKWMGRALKRLNLVVDKKRMASGIFIIINAAKAIQKARIFGGLKDEEHTN